MVNLESLRASQPHAVATLGAAIHSGRVHHAYLLVGQQQQAADQIAQGFALALLCEARQGIAACGLCAPCRKLLGNNHPDALHLAQEKEGTIKVDTVRALAGRLSLRASEAATKVVLAYGADRMNPAAQNALLKTLEEPPGPTCFVLTTSRYRTLLPTVRSRCQRVRVASPTREAATAQLATAGIQSEFGPVAAALVGADVQRAEALQEEGAAEIVETLIGALQPEIPLNELLDVAADLGGNRERGDLALGLLEVLVRDMLASQRGVDRDLLCLPERPLRAKGSPGAAAAALSKLRRLRALHINRRLAIEELLLSLSGHLDPGVSA